MQKIKIHNYINELLIFTTVMTLLSCGGPRIKADRDQLATPYFTAAVNFQRQNHVNIKTPLPLILEDERSLSGLPTSNFLQLHDYLVYSTHNGYLEILAIENIDDESDERISKGVKVPPTYYESHLFIPAEIGDGGLTIYNIESGDNEWFLENNFSRSSPIVDGRSIYHTNTTGTILCLDLENGELLWETNVGDKIKTHLALADSFLIAVTERGIIRAINKRNGALAWNKKLSEAVLSYPVIIDDTAMIVTYSGKIILLNTRNGQIKKQLDFGMNLYTSPSSDGKIVVLPMSDGRLWVYEVDSWQPRWNVQLEGPVTAPTLITQNCILAGTAQGHFYVIDKFSGEVYHDFELDGRPRSTPLLANQKVFIGYEYKNLAIFKYDEDAN